MTVLAIVAGCVFIFPSYMMHRVAPVTKGTRKVIITFFCSELEGKTKNNCNYSVKSHFFKLVSFFSKPTIRSLSLLGPKW